MEQNSSRNRKSESREVFEQADNAGRFAGDDADAQAAKRQATENIREDSGSSQDERDKDGTNAEARRDPDQAHDYKEEAQNVNDDSGRPLNEEESNHARNKASEGIRQGRNES